MDSSKRLNVIDFTCCLQFSKYELKNVSYVEVVRNTNSFDNYWLLFSEKIKFSVKCVKTWLKLSRDRILS